MNRRRQRMFDVALRLNLGRYRLLIVAFSPYLIGYTVWRAFRDGGWRYFAQRFGFAYRRPWARVRCLWLHCASVGELNAAAPLIELIRQRRPDEPLLITTNTPTAAAVLAGRQLDGVQHAYLPLDLAGPVDLFIRRFRPRIGLIMETELWPNLYNSAAVWEVPLAMVNARLSPKTLQANAWLRAGYQVCFGALNRILARSEADAAAFRELGVSAELVETVGSIKFATPAIAAEPVLDGGYVLAISTHDDEEVRLARIWRELDPAGRVLVIAPRHPERRDAILGQLRPLGLEPGLRSRGDPLPGAGIYLADTLGEMQGLIAGAELVVMGGSLIDRGGQNPLEPASAGKPVLCGPHMQNFAVEMQALGAAQAVLQVDDDAGMQASLQRWLAAPDEAAAYGARAAALMREQGPIAERYFERLQELGLI